MKTLTFKSKNLAVDYLTFNIQGTPDYHLVEQIAKYLFQNFGFNSIISNADKVFFSKTNKHQVEFAFYQRATKTKLNSFWDGTQIRFSGKNAARFYQLIQQDKINWDFFKSQNIKLAKFNSFSLSRVDLCYSRKNFDQSHQTAFKSFLDGCHAQILQQSNIKHLQYDRNEKKFILKVGSRKSPNYYRVYENNQEIRFELEMKNIKVQSVQHFLFDRQIQEFEHLLTQHFYNHSKKILVLDQLYTDWLIQYFRRKEKQDAGFLLPFFNQNSLSLSDTKKVFGLLQFLSFTKSTKRQSFETIETIMLDHQQYYLITFPLREFATFLDQEKKYDSYGDRYRRQKYIQFFNHLQQIKPLITTFSDQRFRSSVVIPTVAIDKINFDWVARVSIAKELYLYEYPFNLNSSLLTYKTTYELLIRLHILQSFAVNRLEKTLDVQTLLQKFNVSTKKQADNKRLIITHLNQLPIQQEYKLQLKNGKTQIKTKLTTLIIGKTKIIHFYETI